MNDSGFEVLTAVSMKTFTSWSITPCGSVKVNKFLKNISYPSSRSKSKPRKKTERIR
jgi:hypothetical protein